MVTLVLAPIGVQADSMMDLVSFMVADQFKQESTRTDTVEWLQVISSISNQDLRLKTALCTTRKERYRT